MAKVYYLTRMEDEERWDFRVTIKPNMVPTSMEKPFIKQLFHYSVDFICPDNYDDNKAKSEMITAWQCKAQEKVERLLKEIDLINNA